MKLKILIAEPCNKLREGLHTIFVGDKHITNIYEARTREELQICLHSHSIDFVIVNQALITDITSLPRGHFVILTPKLDIPSLQRASKYGARGYLLENTSAELLRTTLSASEGAFLIEPILASQVIKYMSGNTWFTISDGMLTPREREIVSLLREGIARRTIARQLCISEATLKTHIKNIMRKREDYSSAN